MIGPTGSVRQRGARIGCWLVIGAGCRRRSPPFLPLDAALPFKLNQDRRHHIPRQRARSRTGRPMTPAYGSAAA